jgi:hypothetical protein
MRSSKSTALHAFSPDSYRGGCDGQGKGAVVVAEERHARSSVLQPAELRKNVTCIDFQAFEARLARFS